MEFCEYKVSQYYRCDFVLERKRKIGFYLMYISLQEGFVGSEWNFGKGMVSLENFGLKEVSFFFMDRDVDILEGQDLGCLYNNLMVRVVL